MVSHSDRGSEPEFSASLFGKACSALGVDQSMGRVGSCFDNAAIESWHSTLEFELLSRHRFATKAQARWEMARFIDWCNRARRHSTLRGQVPPRLRGAPGREGCQSRPRGRRRMQQSPTTPSKFRCAYNQASSCRRATVLQRR